MKAEFKRRSMQSLAVLLLLVMTGSVAAENVQTLNAGTKEDVVVDGYRTAGIINVLGSMEGEALARVAVADSETILVAAAQEASQTEADPWENRLMANVEESLNVRDGAGENCNIVGKLFRGSVAEIVSRENGWTQIVSGNVRGYVKDEYCVMGQAAEQLAAAVCEVKATVTTDGLRIRQEANEGAKVLKTAYVGNQFTVDTSVTAPEGWVAVKCGDATAYVCAQYVEVAVAYVPALTVEEWQAIVVAQKAAEEKAAAERAAAAAKKAARQTSSTGVTQNAAVAASCDDVTLLAALIQCEAGSEPYEGKLAVGAVVMNRLRSGRYGSSIYDVIYAKGQFTPARSGKVANVVAKGPSASCRQAAQDALNGMDNTGGATSFRRASSGHAGVVIGHHVFF